MERHELTGRFALEPTPGPGPAASMHDEGGEGGGRYGSGPISTRGRFGGRWAGPLDLTHSSRTFLSFWSDLVSLPSGLRKVPGGSPNFFSDVPPLPRDSAASPGSVQDGESGRPCPSPVKGAFHGGSRRYRPRWRVAFFPRFTPSEGEGSK